MPIKAADIAYQSRIDSYNVSRAVKALEKKNLINIQPDQHSRNIKYLVLNEQGIKLYQQITEAIDERSKEFESVLDEDESALFYSMLEKLENKAEKLLAEQAIDKIASGQEPPADQKELIRWYKKSQGKSE